MVRPVLPGVEHGDDVRMQQIGRRPRLALEALDAALARQLLRLGHLQRHSAFQQRIVRLVDPAERPFAQVAGDLEAADPRRQAGRCGAGGRDRSGLAWQDGDRARVGRGSWLIAGNRRARRLRSAVGSAGR